MSDEQVRNLTEGEFLDALSHESRRRILEIVYDRVEVTYTELLERVRIGEGTLNFHLRRLEGLLQHTTRGTYILSEHGRLAMQILGIIRRSLPCADLKIRESSLTADIVMRRVAAFLMDALIFFVFSGAFMDPSLWMSVRGALLHLTGLAEGHPWIFHLEHLAEAGRITQKIVGVYAHIFFAVYIFVTVLEAFKGQTPGKYLFGIRVVKADGGRVGLIESAIRNGGKVFLLPLDLILGLLFYRRKGFMRFFDYYTEVITERVIKGVRGGIG